MNDRDTNFSVLQEIADLSAEGVVVHDLREKKLIYSNPVASRLLGLRTGASQADIERIFTTIAPEDKEYIRSKYLTIASRSVTTDVEMRINAAGGDDIFICCTAYLVANGTAIVVFIRDITKPKEHEDYLVEFGARKNTLLDTLTHHMSGALNLMRHLSSEAEKYLGVSPDKNLRTYLKLLNDNNTYCLEIIDDLMRNEHQKSPEIFVKNARIDIVDRISIIHQELQQSFRDRKFLFDHSTDSSFINVDEIKLLQVVNNFVSNAIKFSLNETPIRIRIAETAGEVVVSVSDQGIGIPAALQPTIFERQRGNGRTGLNGERSNGIGLSICKNLIELMGGRIWFDSKEHEGSTFSFSLPKNND